MLCLVIINFVFAMKSQSGSIISGQAIYRTVLCQKGYCRAQCIFCICFLCFSLLILLTCFFLLNIRLILKIYIICMYRSRYYQFNIDTRYLHFSTFLLCWQTQQRCVSRASKQVKTSYLRLVVNTAKSHCVKDVSRFTKRFHPAAIT